MIDANQLQSFIADIEWMKNNSVQAAKAPAPAAGAKAAPYDPFEEVLARAIGMLQEKQAAGSQPQGESLEAQLQLLGMGMMDAWLNPGATQSKAVSQADLDSLFPDLAKLGSSLGIEKQ
jgi:hypothetical protein